MMKDKPGETQNVRKLKGLLGMARRAGRLTAGFDAVAALIADGKAEAVLLAGDLSEKTAKELRFAAARAPKPPPLYALTLDKEALKAALGYAKPIGVIALDDKGFAASVTSLLGSPDAEAGAQTGREERHDAL